MTVYIHNDLLEIRTAITSMRSWGEEKAVNERPINSPFH